MNYEQLKRAYFNGRILNGAFRRGFWKASELEQADIKNKPALPAGAYAGLWYNGSWAFVINKTEAEYQVVYNTKQQNAGTLADFWINLARGKGLNVSINTANLGGKTCIGRQADLDSRLF